MAPEQLPLRDIHLPPAISWWPPAVGWWLLLAMSLALFVWAHPRRRRSLKRAALRALAAVERDFMQHGDPRRLVQELSVWLRRVAMSYGPRESTAGLTGEVWLKQLDRMTGSRHFTLGPGRVFGTGPYEPAVDVDGRTLLRLCRAWLGSLPHRYMRPGAQSL